MKRINRLPPTATTSDEGKKDESPTPSESEDKKQEEEDAKAEEEEADDSIDSLDFGHVKHDPM